MNNISVEKRQEIGILATMVDPTSKKKLYTGEKVAQMMQVDTVIRLVARFLIRSQSDWEFVVTRQRKRQKEVT